MKIDKIEAYHVALPVKSDRELVIGDKPVGRLETVLVRLVSGGASGWGEVSPGTFPLNGPEWAGGVLRCVIDCLAPAIMTQPSIETGDALTERLKDFSGNRMAKAALDIAWWDLKARIVGRPLHEALGAKRKTVEVGVGFDRMESIDLMLEGIEKAFDDGYSRVELKLRPGWDLDLLNIVRSRFPTQRFHADLEGALTMENADLLYRLDDFHLDMVEQPLAAEDLVGHAMLQDTLHTPLALDESVTTPAQAELAIDLQAGHRFNLEPGKIGGLTAAIAIQDMAAKGNIGCWVGVRPQSAIGTRAAFALAARIEGVYPADYFPASDYLESDLAEPLTPSRDGDGPMQIALDSEPGIGIDPDEKLLEKYCVKQAALKLA